jgi:hypothetical protein
VVALSLGEDADNIRIDPRNGHAVVGYGDGALAVVDLDSRSIVARIDLPAHPEGFQIDGEIGRAYVNLPDARTIGVVDLDKGELIDRWKLPLAWWNYPLALAPTGEKLVTVFRAPARLVQFNRASGAEAGSISTCGDADDVFTIWPATGSTLHAAAAAWTSSMTPASNPNVSAMRTRPRALALRFSIPCLIGCLSRRDRRAAANRHQSLCSSRSTEP